MIKKIYSYCFLFLFTNLILIQKLNADYLFPAGSKSKIVGMANPAESSGSFATLYNPSNISVDKDSGNNYSLDSEAGFFYLKHSYDHPKDYKINMNVKSNFATLGSSVKITDSLYLGAIVFPDKYVKMSVKNLPQRIFPSYVANLDVYMKELQLQFGLGASYKISNLKLGLALKDTYEKTHLKITTANDQTTINYLDAHSNNLSWVSGINLSIPDYNTELSLAYTPKIKKKYHGQSEFILDQDPDQDNNQDQDSDQDKRITDFSPSTLSFGVTHLLSSKLKLTLAGLYSYWTQGKNNLNNKYSNIVYLSDIKNTFDYFISIQKQFISSVISFGLSYIHSPWGPGSFSDDPTNFAVGTDFTKLNNTNRYTMGLGYGLSLASWFLEFIGSYSYGSRSIPMSGYNPGKYSTQLILVEAQASYSF